MELRSEQKKGCVKCVDVHSCPDAFTTDSQYCNSYGSIIVKSDSSDFLKSTNQEFLQCSRLLFDDFEERFLEYIKTLNLPVDFRLERYGDELDIEYFAEEDYEGKCPYTVDNSDAELKEFAEKVVGFLPEKIIPSGEYVYFIGNS